MLNPKYCTINLTYTHNQMCSASSLVKAFGNAKIVDRCLDVASKTQFVLIQTSSDLTKHT